MVENVQLCLDESLEIVVESMMLIKSPSKDLCPLILIHANIEELVCLSEGSPSYSERMEMDVKDHSLGDEIKKEPSYETESKQILLTRFAIEKHFARNSKASTVEGVKDSESETCKDDPEVQCQSTSVKSDEADEENDTFVLKVKNTGPFLGHDISKFQHVCLPNNRLFDGTLLDKNTTHFLICDSNSLQLFDNNFAKVESSEFSNAAMFVKSKLVSNDAKKEKMAKMACLSPLGLACAVYDPG